MLVPPVAFWGEFEINTLADNARPLPHIWPQGGGLLGLGPLLRGWLVALVAVPHPVPGQDDRHQHHRAVRCTS